MSFKGKWIDDKEYEGSGFIYYDMDIFMKEK